MQGRVADADAPGHGLRKGARVGSKDAAVMQAYTERFLGDLARAVDLLATQPGVGLETFDGVVNLPKVSIPLLFQFAERDEWITRADADSQVAAAAGPTTVQWHRTDHALDAGALAARASWLANALAFARVPVMPNENVLPRSQVRAYRRIKPLMRIRNWLAGMRQ